jgi:hypothetical protein
MANAAVCCVHVPSDSQHCCQQCLLAGCSAYAVGNSVRAGWHPLCCICCAAEVCLLADDTCTLVQQQDSASCMLPWCCSMMMPMAGIILCCLVTCTHASPPVMPLVLMWGPSLACPCSATSLIRQRRGAFPQVSECAFHVPRLHSTSQCYRTPRSLENVFASQGNLVQCMQQPRGRLLCRVGSIGPICSVYLGCRNHGMCLHDITCVGALYSTYICPCSMHACICPHCHFVGLSRPKSVACKPPASARFLQMCTCITSCRCTCFVQQH